ncbi:class I SAM-dependent methyltransferase [Sorangium sp. So ce381]|uniref:class I SAM-dependent methyltransferase n=1 Tax=Sorangium sp. So ce381 TaxID=3133307 RepID=UPI003F5AEB6B
MSSSSAQFWQSKYVELGASSEIPRLGEGPTIERFVSLLGDLEGLQVLDLGCGPGQLTLHLAGRGAHVTAVDLSPAAVENTLANAARMGFGDRVRGRALPAHDIGSLGKRFDLVAGIFILHHLEPFEEFARVLRSVVKPGGRALFVENSARNPLLMFARRNLVGKYGIPKHGDDEEHPLEPREIDILRGQFSDVSVHFAELVFLRMINTYVFRNAPRFSRVTGAIARLDDYLYSRVPATRRLSYLQLLELTA